MKMLKTPFQNRFAKRVGAIAITAATLTTLAACDAGQQTTIAPEEGDE